jgi:formylglycine-generating enzyme required for sulfatase activity
LGLSIHFSGGQAQLSVTGAVNSACQIQWTDNFSTTNPWFHLVHCVLHSSPSFLTDLTSSTATRRYYRAVWTPNTNFVWIPPGTFAMGSPASEAERQSDEHQHTVTISRGYWMEKYEVTQGGYLAVVGTNPSYFRNGVVGPNGGNGGSVSNELLHPVEMVSWIDASNYCALRTQQEQLAGLIPTNYVYRLPTESEWEYASRAGTTTAFYLGDSLHSGQANFSGKSEYDAVLGRISNPDGIYLGRTTPVGSYAPNGWGLYDMIGNVAEWCQDWYGEYPAQSVIDPQGPPTGSYRLVRGGQWNDGATGGRSAIRLNGPDGTFFKVGFRVVLAPTHP